MPKPTLDRLTRREREIMDAIFAGGNRASAEDIRSRLIDSPSYSVVRTMLTRLEQKGYVRHHALGNRYIYSATASPAAVQRAGLRRFLGVFFEGSTRNLVTSLLRNEEWSDEALDALQSEIDRVRKQRRRP